MSCKELKNKNTALLNGFYQFGLFWAYCDMSNNGWTLVARFSNNDAKNWINNSFWWYDMAATHGTPTNSSENTDMISKAFWTVKGNEIKITRSDDANHTALLHTTSNCLRGTTFRSKITSYGNFRNVSWAYDECRGSCQVSYGGQYNTTAGFLTNNCNSNIQNGSYIGFWCDWSSGDGAVMMIGGGGATCSRADHGIGITEIGDANFGPGDQHHDFGDIHDFKDNAPSNYSLNLWVR